MSWLLKEDGGKVILEDSSGCLLLEFPIFFSAGLTLDAQFDIECALSGVYGLGGFSGSMTSEKQDFVMWSGDHKNITFSVTGSDGNGQDLTGASVVWYVENEVGSGSLVRKNTGGSGITISGSQFTVSLSPADTSGLRGHYYHEAEVTDSASNTTTVAVGTVIIQKSGIVGV